jgi:hypothetical protein
VVHDRVVDRRREDGNARRPHHHGARRAIPAGAGDERAARAGLLDDDRARRPRRAIDCVGLDPNTVLGRDRDEVRRRDLESLPGRDARDVGEDRAAVQVQPAIAGSGDRRRTARRAARSRDRRWWRHARQGSEIGAGSPPRSASHATRIASNASAGTTTSARRGAVAALACWSARSTRRLRRFVERRRLAPAAARQIIDDLVVRERSRASGG